MNLEEILDDLSFLDGWEDRYRYIIDLGEQLTTMDESLKTEEAKVHGCMSQVWMAATRASGDDPIVTFTATSDAVIVKGLIALLMAIYNNRRASEIRGTDHKAIFAKLQLEGHLSMTRRNGLASMVQRIQTLAA